ncbi:MAG TPA: LodA/GoxA family CTQ-dependent oxidase [Longimicrobium sp.]|nr:LodA/GoxA family CTQ-dependent oxidase [Longimicrobium sp.]
MPPIYRIHPAIGIARLGNSPDEFYISPEAPAALPIECDEHGETTLGPDGREATIKTFKDEQHRVKRQAARFQVYVYDEQSPHGRPLQLNEPVAGGGYQGTLVDVEWRVWLANKKAAWYQFQQLQGEHGYAPDHPRRNPGIKGKTARGRLVIDPGPRTVSMLGYRTAEFSRDGGVQYAPTFPPRLRPHSIDTLGRLMTDSCGRLLVLGGHGNAGTFNYKQFGQPRIDHYANNDGWFDDTSDGPVMARLVMKDPETQQLRFVDVEYPAWVVAGYPGYCPEILDMITMDDLLQDLHIRQFATRTELYGQSGTFDDPQHVDPQNAEALQMWRAGRLQWNPDYRPWFYRDVWNILFRPDQFSYLSDVLGLSNFPHNQSTRGTFDPVKLGTPPRVNARRVRDEEERLVERLLSGDLFMEGLEPVLEAVEKEARTALSALGSSGDALRSQMPGLLTGEAAEALRASVAAYVAALRPAAAEGGAPRPDPETAPDAAAGAGTMAQPGPSALKSGAADAVAAAPGAVGLDGYLHALREAGPRPELAQAREELESRVAALVVALPGQEEKGEPSLRARSVHAPAADGGAGAVLGRAATRLRKALQDHLRKLHSGRLLEEARKKAVAAHTVDEYRPYRQFLYDLLRRNGEENRFFAGGKPDSRTHNLPLMPLLAGDNPISNSLVSKFLRLTDYQLFVLRQWAEGLFRHEELEGWGSTDPWNPYAGWVNRTGHDLDRGVISQVAGGAFCPGCELGWVMRNPSIYYDVYRIKADPVFSAFQETAAQANQTAGQFRTSEQEYSSYIQQALSLKNDFSKGLQPGDLTKYMALPWQADFNECSTQTIDVTYEGWNVLYPKSDKDEQLKAAERQWETLWWPAHRPMQVFVPVPGDQGTNYDWQVWALGIPQTGEGDYKMVTDWWRLGFVRKNPDASPDMSGDIAPPPQVPPYISTEAYPGYLKEEE